VEDLARAHVLALEATSPDDPRTAGPDCDGAAAIAINLGNGGGFSVREVVSAAETVVGHAIPHAIGERRAGDPPVLVADAGRAGEILGWRPAHRDIVEIVASAWNWRQVHPSGYRA
jgi:UDP-glucose 4-epimerase